MTDRLNQFRTIIEKEQSVTLATAADGRVTMRVVSSVNFENAVLIFTFADSVKYKQLQSNPNCCIAAGGFFAECTAKFFGPTMLPENELMRTAYSSKFVDAFDEEVKFGGVKAEFILLTPKKLKGWAFENDTPNELNIPTIPFEIDL